MPQTHNRRAAWPRGGRSRATSACERRSDWSRERHLRRLRGPPARSRYDAPWPRLLAKNSGELPFLRRPPAAAHARFRQMQPCSPPSDSPATHNEAHCRHAVGFLHPPENPEANRRCRRDSRAGTNAAATTASDKCCAPMPKQVRARSARPPRSSPAWGVASGRPQAPGRPSSSCPVAWAPARCWATSGCSRGCAPRTRRCRGPRRCVPARCCSAPPACSTTPTQPRTGSSSTRCGVSARVRLRSASSSAASSSPPPASRPASTWPCTSPPGSLARPPPSRSSSRWNTTPSPRSTAAPPQGRARARRARPRPRSSAPCLTDEPDTSAHVGSPPRPRRGLGTVHADCEQARGAAAFPHVTLDTTRRP